MGSKKLGLNCSAWGEYCQERVLFGNPDTGGNEQMTVGRIMSRDVITVRMDTRLDAIRKLFEKRRFHHILVVDDGELVGIVSDRDILKQLSPFLSTASELPRDRSTLEKRVHQFMTRNPISVGEDMPVETAADMFVKDNISCLPVLSAEEEIVGIITWRDILKKVRFGSKSGPGSH
jgi:acetoin utilization protein AcuB